MGSFAKTVWQYLDGWKTVIAALMLASEHLFPGSGFAHYVDLALNALGWQSVVPAVDPGQLAEWVTLTIGLGHKLQKAMAQIIAGTSMKDLHP